MYGGTRGLIRHPKFYRAQNTTPSRRSTIFGFGTAAIQAAARARRLHPPVTLATYARPHAHKPQGSRNTSGNYREPVWHQNFCISDELPRASRKSTIIAPLRHYADDCVGTHLAAVRTSAKPGKTGDDPTLARPQLRINTVVLVM